MDTDKCIQRLVRTDRKALNVLNERLRKSPNIGQQKEKEAVMNYRCALELNNSVSNKRVQQLYSQDQSQEMIDQAERQATSKDEPWRISKG